MTTEITPYEFIPADVAAAQPTRPRLLVLATAFVSAAISMGFMGMLGFYIGERQEFLARGERWLPDGVNIPLTQPNFMGLTMAFSVVIIWWTVSAIKNDDRANTFIAYAISLVFGFAFLAQTAFLLTIMQIEILATERAVLFYAIIGSHFLLMLLAMGYALVMMLRTIGGEYSSRDYEGVLSAAMFWTVVALLYAALWYTIYITK